MYLPRSFTADLASARQRLDAAVTADLVTATGSGPISTFLPVLYEARAGTSGALLGHLARANDQWRTPWIGEALMTLHGPDAYVSPSWYPSKAEHGRVLPTWNYGVVHAYGRLVVHDDVDWVDALVRRLTLRHEKGRETPWSVDDAPSSFLADQLPHIVGVELLVERVEAKEKWGQNRSGADVDGAIAGLDAAGQHDAAEAMRQANRRGDRRGRAARS